MSDQNCCCSSSRNCCGHPSQTPLCMERSLAPVTSKVEATGRYEHPKPVNIQPNKFVVLIIY